jgi:hypothetical protein
VAPARLERWLAGFGERHGDVTTEVSPEQVAVRAGDGSVATLVVPFPPLAVERDDPYGGLVEHALRPRTVGLFLVRRGGYAAGVVRDRKLAESKVGSRHVQGRSAAGGWSQQRFARRREGQAREAAGAASDTAFRVLTPFAAELDALVTGGDRAMVTAALADDRLRGLQPLVVEHFLNVSDPRRAVLELAAAQALAVRIRVEEPEKQAPDPGGGGISAPRGNGRPS